MTDEFDELINKCWLDNKNFKFNRFGYQPFIKNEILRFVSKYSVTEYDPVEVDDDTKIEDLFFDAEDTDKFSQFYLDNKDLLKQIIN